jgi:hypothetical protein
MRLLQTRTDLLAGKGRRRHPNRPYKRRCLRDRNTLWRASLRHQMTIPLPGRGKFSLEGAHEVHKLHALGAAIKIAAFLLAAGIVLQYALPFIMPP